MFSDLEDPRAPNATHRLSDLMLIAVAASLCGGQCATDFAQFARSKRALLEQVLGPFTPPSHDTFSRVFRLLDPQAFAEAFATFSAAFAQALEAGALEAGADAPGAGAKVVALDGKAVRRAYEVGAAAWPPTLVTAWAAEARCALACLRTGGPGEGAGEAETAIRLVALLDLEGVTVTADALHCHRRMAEAIRARGGEYMLALKGNQSKLLADAKASLARAESDGAVACADTQERAHGRREHRAIRIAPAPDMAERHRFPDLAAVAEIVSTRDDAPPSTRYFLLSRALEPEQALAVARAHWSIENTLHWTLDVTFAEDQSRARKDHAPENLAALARLALSILQRIDDPKTSIRRRIKRCAWEDDYLINAIAHMR